MRHYLDHASTTPLRPEARAAMEAWVDAGVVGDPGRVHAEGRQVRDALEQAREQVAAFVGVRPRQVVFTSGATESVHAAVWGTTGRGPRGTGEARSAGPIACAPVEHSSVREASAAAAPVTWIEVDGNATIEPAAVDAAFDRCLAEHGVVPSLCHCQWANHEVGTVQPVAAVVEQCRSRGVRVHVDAAAAVGHVPTDLGALGADVVSFGSHTLGGPAGIGVTVLGRGVRLEPFLRGGAQERGRRAGFENVVAAVGLSGALGALGALGDQGRLEAEAATAAARTDHLAQEIQAVGGCRRYGDPSSRLPHLVCVGIDGVEAEPILLGLDRAGIAVHSGSSCSSESLEPSPVLAAMGVDAERSLRVSVGWSTTDGDVDAFAAAFPDVVRSLRALRS